MTKLCKYVNCKVVLYHNHLRTCKLWCLWKHVSWCLLLFTVMNWGVYIRMIYISDELITFHASRNTIAFTWYDLHCTKWISITYSTGLIWILLQNVIVLKLVRSFMAYTELSRHVGSSRQLVTSARHVGLSRQLVTSARHVGSSRRLVTLTQTNLITNITRLKSF